MRSTEHLHLMRWVAALFVVIGHAWLVAGYPHDSAVFEFLARHAHAAVMVFFVLSGYVIASTTAKKLKANGTLTDYALDRFSRIYSVLIPAVLLTLALDLAGAQLFPAIYAALPADHFAFRFFVNAFSLQGAWFHRIQFGSNPPLWSIGYEVCYYALFGLATWRPRRWKLAAGAIALLMGPMVLAYGLIWLMGVAVYRRGLRAPLLPALALMLAAEYVLEYRQLWLPEYARDFLFGWTVASVVASSFPIPRALQRANRAMADFSYSLYAYHFPVMFIVAAAVPGISCYALIAIALAASRVLYEVTEKQRGRLRHGVSSLLEGRRLRGLRCPSPFRGRAG